LGKKLKSLVSLVVSDYENEHSNIQELFAERFREKIFIEKIQKILDSESQLRYSNPRK